MLYEIKHRYSGAVLFSLDCASLKICVEAAVAAKVSLDFASLDGASLRDASLRGASLDGASLRGASLRGASLDGASLRGASLVASLGQPNNWYAFTYCTQGEQRVQVGCRNFNIAEGREYWANKPDRREVLAALDYAEAIGRIRGWK